MIVGLGGASSAHAVCRALTGASLVSGRNESVHASGHAPEPEAAPLAPPDP
jgi:hypothetical protein